MTRTTLLQPSGTHKYLADFFFPYPGFNRNTHDNFLLDFFLTSHATPAYSFLHGLWCLLLALDGVSLRFRFIRYKLTSLNILFFHSNTRIRKE